jgi:hypothetical protein
MYDDGVDGATGPLRRLLGAPVALAVVVTYLVLAAATLVLRALYGVVPRTRRSGAVAHAEPMRFDEAR